MRPYNTYRYTGKEGQNLSQACCSCLNPASVSESTVDASTVDFLQSLIQPIDTVVEPIAFDVPVASDVNSIRNSQECVAESEREPERKRVDNLGTAPNYWSFDEPAPIAPQNVCRPQLRRAETAAFREPPVLARVPQYAEFEQQAVPEALQTAEPILNIEESNEVQLSITIDNPDESVVSEPLVSASPVAGIEKMETVSPFSSRGTQTDRWVELKAFAGRLIHDDSFKLMSISCLMVALVLGSVSYRMSRNNASTSESPAIAQETVVPESPARSEFAVQNVLAASEQKAQSSKPDTNPSSNFAADTQTPIETSVVVNQVSGESVPGTNNVAPQSFTEQMRQESQEDYSSPEIFAEESVTPSMEASFAVNQADSDPVAANSPASDDSVRRLPPPPSGQAMAQTAPVAPAIASSAQAETAQANPFASQNNGLAQNGQSVPQNGAFNRNMDTQAPLNAYGTHNSSDMYSYQTPQNQYEMYNSAETDSYVSPTLGDDSVEGVQVPYTALNPANQVR